MKLPQLQSALLALAALVASACVAQAQIIRPGRLPLWCRFRPVALSTRSRACSPNG